MHSYSYPQTLRSPPLRAPTSGGQYHWVSILAPRSYERVFSYITGWVTVVGWQGVIASAGYLNGTLIQGLIALVWPEYDAKLWHGTLLFYATVALCLFINTVVSRALPGIESMILVLYVLGFFGILVPLVYLAPHGSAADVFQTFTNGGNWSSQGLSFFVGLSGTVFAFLGADGAVHMSEEINHASTVVPRALVFSIGLNGTLGFAMLLAELFCLGDPAIFANVAYPFMGIFLNATNSTTGAAVMSAVIILISLVSTVGLLASASRMLWAFARDKGVPGHAFVGKVNSHKLIPLNAIFVTTTITLLLGLISIGSPTAFSDLLSLTINGLYSSYFIVCALLFWRRVTGNIRTPDAAEFGAGPRRHITNAPGSSGQDLCWGPWRVPGVLGVITNGFACIFMLIILFFSFWPQATPVTLATMNWSVLIVFSVVILSTIYYMVWAHRTYTGPIVEIEVDD